MYSFYIFFDDTDCFKYFFKNCQITKKYMKTILLVQFLGNFCHFTIFFWPPGCSNFLYSLFLKYNLKNCWITEKGYKFMRKA